MAEKKTRKRRTFGVRFGDSSDRLNFIVRADFLICFVIIPVGIFIGWLFGANPFLTIPLVGILAVLVIVCMRSLRNLK